MAYIKGYVFNEKYYPYKNSNGGIVNIGKYNKLI